MEKKNRVSAIVSLVAGILSAFFYWLFFPLPFVAWISALIALNKYDPSTDKGKGMAITGLVLGLLFTLQLFIKAIL